MNQIFLTLIFPVLLSSLFWIGLSTVHPAKLPVWPGIVAYGLGALILLIRWGRSGQEQDTNASPLFTWKTLALAGGILFVAGQACILRPEWMAKVMGPQFSATVPLGIGLIMAGIAAAGPFALGASGGVDATPRVMKWFLIAFLLAGFLAWSLGFLHRASFDFGDHRMYSLFDDAMISLRYAWNLTQGNGLVWNIGERVEGYTNLLMVLVMSLGTFFFGLNGAVLYTHWMGIGFVITTAFLLRGVAAEVLKEVPETRRGFYEAMAFLAPLTYYPLAYWSIMGMETGLLAMLVTAAVWLVIRPVSQVRVNPWLSLLLGLMVLVRPDASVQAGILLGFRLITRWPRRGAVITVLVEGLLFCILPVSQIIFRHVYYGEWLPNTYILKMVGLDPHIRLLGGWGFMKLFLHSAWPALLVGTWGALRPLREAKALIWCLMISVMAYQVYVGGDPWPYWRIMAPYMPMLLVLNIAGLESLLAGIWRSGKTVASRFQSGNAIWLTALTLLVMVIGWANLKFTKEFFLIEQPFTVFYNAAHVRIGLNLRKVCTPDATVGVLWAGTIPYYSQLRGIDFLGKCDKTIANRRPDPNMAGHGMLSMPGHNKYDLKYSIEECKPDYIQNYYWAANDETEYALAHYVMKDNMWLRKDSEKIYWDRLPQ